MQKIYYVYEKATGKFAGSGTPFFDDNVHGCTETPSPYYREGYVCFYNVGNDTWEEVPEVQEQTE